VATRLFCQFIVSQLFRGMAEIHSSRFFSFQELFLGFPCKKKTELKLIIA